MQPAPGSAKVYLGPDGLRVDVIRLQTPDRSDYLVRILGTRSEIDGLVLACRFESVGKEEAVLATRLHGENYNLIRKRVDRQYMYLPEHPNNVTRITYDRALSASLDPHQMITAHLQMRLDESLAAVSRFDRAGEIAKQEQQFAAHLEACNQKCQMAITGRIEFDTFSDDAIKSSSLAGYCGMLSDALWTACKSQRACSIIKDKVKRITCRYGTESSLHLERSNLIYAFDPLKPVLDRRVPDLLDRMPGLVPGSTLAEIRIWEKTTMCTDGKDRFVGLQPHEDGVRIVFGDGKTFTRMRPGIRATGDFFDPREFNPDGNRSFRGLDLRYMSELEYDREQGTCELRCGQRKMPLQLLGLEQTRERLGDAKFLPPPVCRRPYALARDRKGIYYYVDVTDEQGARDFRVYRGPKGKLERLDMENVVLDSGGDVFVTREGTLRLVLEKKNSYWIVRGKSSPLVNLQIEENLTTIYNELGIYLGVPLGTPCDIF